MLRAVARPLVNLVERWMPDALVFAIVLTFVVALMALGLTDSTPLEVLRGWGDGLAGLLEFIAQIAIVLVLGHTLAHTGPVERMLRNIARFPRTPAMAYAFVTVIAGLASLISWALGLIVGGIVAFEVARVARSRGIRLHYPLLVACAYSGYVVWHMGYSGSGPLAAATPGSFLEELEFGLVPVTQTTFSAWNIAAAAATLAAVTVAMVLLRPRGEDPIVELAEKAVTNERSGTTARSDDLPRADSPVPPGGAPEDHAAPPSPAERVDGSRLLTLALGAALVAYLVVYFAQEGFALTLDIVNWSFLAAILLLVSSPRELVGLITNAGRTVGNVLLQYPLYAGILGMMTATGLVDVLSGFFVSISTPATLSVWAMISGGIVNMFIPSGGGQFAVQGPIFLQAAQELGTDPAPVIMGIAYGDQWTNMIQPFWTIPLLAIAGLTVRDIMGYTTITLFVSGAVMLATLLLVGAG
ncbi:short-chain fatty acid transporter [Rubrobacter xylanophilus]|uniref:Short-chain fatty acid transporter n=1 Tax=Rubrobacter xylanophilus TaxID=49319 RepID=A0A510HNQ8_9ACTN|nr:TIGR00366 family protein [Rubrobacter xylanophilus]BBL80237.1 short-chain fatty acid transporter [Rubrobacter xylanophilus]